MTFKPRTGPVVLRFMKLRVWEPASLTWCQLARGFEGGEEGEAAAVEAARDLAKAGARWQAIRLEGRDAKSMRITVLFDSAPEVARG